MPRAKRVHLLLIHPPSPYLLRGFASGLISLANYVQSAKPDVEVEIVDHSEAGSDLIASALSDAHATALRVIVGITTTTATYQAALRVAETCKSVCRESVVVLGGHHATPEADIILRDHPEVDYVIRGEGEKALLALVSSVDSPERIPGLVYRGANGSTVRNPMAPPLRSTELDSIPPTWRGKSVVGTPGKFGHATLCTARGCPLDCAFCAVGEDAIRAKTVSAVVKDVQLLVSLGFNRLAIEDNFFAQSASRTLKLCAALAELRRKGMGFSWDCQTRVESLLREDVVRALAAAGCEAVYLGVESLVPEQLLYLRKTRDPALYLERLRDRVGPLLLRYGINIYLNLQLGLPNESDSGMNTTVASLAQLGSLARSAGRWVRVYPMLHVVYPGTPHFVSGLAARRFRRDVFESFTRWEYHRKPVVRWLGEHFAHGTGGIPVGILDPAKLASDEFEVDPGKTGNISLALDRLRQIPGIDVFRYEPHLIAGEGEIVAGER